MQDARMSRVALVVSDVDGTLLTKDKILTDDARSAAQRLHDAGIAFTIISSRPIIGMRFLIGPLGITLPVGAFNGSSIVDPKLKPLEQHLIPASAVKRSLQVLNEFGVDSWLFTNEKWLTRNGNGEYVSHEKLAIRADPTVVADFAPYLTSACKIVGSSSDPVLLQRCEDAMQHALGTMATAVRSQSYYLDVTPPGCDKGTFVEAIARRLDISTDVVATIGDMQNDLAMFRKSGVSIAMGNATDDVKRLTTHVTRSNEDEGFAGAIDIILKENRAG
jgi:Cof subfamily protein (haloacid dehalogenase superfamily)